MLAALAAGESRIDGAGDGADVRSTAGDRARARRDRRAVGRGPAATVDYRVVSPGADGLRAPAAVLDCGNSGTSLRLIDRHPRRPAADRASSTATIRCAAVRSLVSSNRCARWARRSTPAQNDSLPPLTVVGRTPLRAIDYTTPVPSAQVKSAILLAGLRAEGRTTVRESVATRDHTERMLRARGVPVERAETPDGAVAWTVEGGLAVQAIDERVPGDVSAAAFWLVAGAIHPDAELDAPRRRRQPDPARGHRHPARDGRRHRGAAARSPPRRRRRRADRRPARALLDAPGHRPRPGRRRRRDRRDPDPVPGGDRGRPARPSSAAPASCATRNRTGSPASRRACARSARGSRSTATTSTSTAATALHGAATDSLDDHRLAMTFAIAGLIATGETSIGRPGSAAISYPGFFDDLERVRA